ncbi:hypothetical protein [Streptomyces sp. NPDC021212]|uniref:hypothetical protein n=1 Tax=Streptomyces sp. NPDC021212 TaxID=3365118 RepID=UPI00378AE517
MSHLSTLRARKAAAAMAIAVAALGLTACQGNEKGASSSQDRTSASATQSPGSSGKADGAKASKGVPNKPDVKCTDRINYAGDPRDNATINSIGSDTGTCPPVQSDKSEGTPNIEGVKCTDQINYGEDSRDNATINSIGSDTGTCPPVQRK